MLCGGHVWRAHGKKLQELQTKSTFTKGFIDLHKKGFLTDGVIEMCLQWKAPQLCFDKKQASLWLFWPCLHTK